MDKKVLNDIVDWDVENWSQAINYWETNVDLNNKNFNCLELGSNKGGLSLWLALKGNKVICSDLESPEKVAYEIHKKYACSNDITYQSLNATDLPFANKFDVVTFKSILGGISRNGNKTLKQQTIDEMYKVLKSNGVLLFAENIEGSFLHKFLRKNFIKWGAEWNYLTVNEIETLFSAFKKINYITVGFWGVFGRNNKQRDFLGKFDRIFEKLVPKSKRYILIGIAEK
jgi:SAM-dependent methyltransferase